jgi:hypothetical protein
MRATDGNAGRLAGLTVELAGGYITQLVFRQRQTYATCTYALPMAAAAEVGPEAVYVRSSRASIAAMDPQLVQTRPSTLVRSQRVGD